MGKVDGDCRECEYLKGIRTLLEQTPKNIHDERIFDIGVLPPYNTLYQSTDGEIRMVDTVGEESYPIVGLEEGDLYNIYIFLDANWRTLQSKDTLIELPDVGELEWVEKPVEIKSGEDTIGVVGVYVAETIDDKELRGVRFISPDGTYTTLTMFGNDSKEETDIAKNDLERIAEVLMRLSDKL